MEFESDVLESRAIFEWENRPPGVSWINELNAAQAVAQCNKWGLIATSTLEANRVILKDHIRRTVGAQPGTPTGDRVEINVQPPTPQNQPTIPNQSQAQWLELVQATAQAVGSQVASALASQADHRQTALPHVIRELATAIPSCSGADALLLLRFLRVARQIIKLELASDKQILLTLLSKTSGQLRAMWTDAILLETPVAQLVTDVVNVFLPDRARQQLLSQAVYRAQGPNESLADFVMDVREAAEILLPQGQDILDTIITGINPPTRARLAGFPTPTRVSDLISLIPRVEVVRQMEQQHARATVPQNNNAILFQSGSVRPRGIFHGQNRAPFHQRQFREDWSQRPFAEQPRLMRPFGPNQHRPPGPGDSSMVNRNRLNGFRGRQ